MGELKRLKAYCIHCDFYRVVSGNDVCCNQKNLGTWKSPTAPRKHPSELNSGNDCNWYFERREE